MITCAHKDCNYRSGWTHKDSDKNELIEPQEGDFYEMKSGFTSVSATRIGSVDDDVEMNFLGCPKCHRTFISKGETYLDDQQA